MRYPERVPVTTDRNSSLAIVYSLIRQIRQGKTISDPDFKSIDTTKMVLERGDYGSQSHDQEGAGAIAGIPKTVCVHENEASRGYSMMCGNYCTHEAIPRTYS
jgi:hypothetical protein